MDIYQYDETLREQGYRLIAGIDEAGRGPLAGPVVAAAVVLKNGVTIDGLRDSKKVPESERNILFPRIQEAAAAIGVGIVGPGDIDRLNILKATRQSMEIAVENLFPEPEIMGCLLFGVANSGASAVWYGLRTTATITHFTGCEVNVHRVAVDPHVFEQAVCNL